MNPLNSHLFDCVLFAFMNVMDEVLYSDIIFINLGFFCMRTWIFYMNTRNLIVGADFDKATEAPACIVVVVEMFFKPKP